MEEIDYHLLSIEEQHDMLVRTLIAQERDHYVHTMNQERYEFMLAEADAEQKDSPWYQQIAKLLSDTKDRKHEVSTIISALKKQLPNKDLVMRAAGRIRLAELERKVRA